MKIFNLYFMLFIASNVFHEAVMFEHSFSDIESVVQALLEENKDMKTRIAELERRNAENNNMKKHIAELERKDAEKTSQVENLKNRIFTLEEKCSRISDESLKSVVDINEKGLFNSSYIPTEGTENTHAGNSESNFSPGFGGNFDTKQSGISSSKLSQRPRQSPKRAAESEAAFHVYLSGGRCYSNHEIFIFDREAVDIGDRYNIHDGIYDAPTTGLYVFTWTVAASFQTWFAAELIVNGAVKGVVMADADTGGSGHGIHPATGVVLTNVNAGDHVFIRFVKGDSCHVQSDARTRTTFSGWLL